LLRVKADGEYCSKLVLDLEIIAVNSAHMPALQLVCVVVLFAVVWCSADADAKAG
jgi:hypothetical protein